MSKKDISRRDFIKNGSIAAVGLGVGTMFGGFLNLGNGVVAIPASEGYLLVDTKKCAGCTSCMLACSAAHHDRTNLSLSRIQILQNPYAGYPNDISLNQCKQCPAAPCTQVCPTGALSVDEKTGYVRMVDERKCIGCQQCVEACPQTPSRIIWNFEDKHAQKCDLCTNTPYWDEEGGVEGKQACIQICPMKAITFTKEIPAQTGNSGYDINLRTDAWEKLFVRPTGSV